MYKSTNHCGWSFFCAFLHSLVFLNKQNIFTKLKAQGMLQKYFNSYIKPYAYYSTDSVQVIYQMFNQLVKFRKSFCNFTGCFFICKTLLILLYQCRTSMLNHCPRFLIIIFRLFNILIPHLSC